MKLAKGLALLSFCIVSAVYAQTDAPRAWQQRIDIAVDLPVPVVELASVNPFAIEVDVGPKLLASTPPRKIDVAGTAVVAAYVDAKGTCLGGVPLELPFPGLTATLLTEIEGNRFDPATKGETEVPSWVTLGIGFTGRVKDSTVSSPSFDLPDPATPPEPDSPLQVAPPGRLRNAGYEPQDELTTVASPRRLRVKASSQDATVSVRALLHITAAGRCDRFVPLNLEPGLHSWLSAFLTTWRLEPATLNGEPHDVWVFYSARATLELSALSSESITVLRDRNFVPPPVD